MRGVSCASYGMTRIKTMDQAEAAAAARFQAAADEYREDLTAQWGDALPGNHSPAEAVLLAYLLTGKDGYNAFVWRDRWENRVTSGWHTSAFYMADPYPGIILSFALETRLGAHFRRLAIEVEHHSPGERSPDRIAQDNTLAAKGWRIFTVSEQDVLANPEDVLDRIEALAFRMAEEVIAATG